MPQEIIILKCYKCITFQTQISKKAKQWVCKVCGEKQSLKKVYGRGNGKDCRTLVQELNKTQNEEETNCDNFELQDQDNVELSAEEKEIVEKEVGISKSSKWLRYLQDEN